MGSSIESKRHDNLSTTCDVARPEFSYMEMIQHSWVYQDVTLVHKNQIKTGPQKNLTGMKIVI